MAQRGTALMAGNSPRGIRERPSASNQPRYQVRYHVCETHHRRLVGRRPRSHSPRCEKPRRSRQTAITKRPEAMSVSTLA